jgi:hypothetical protein
MRIACWIPKFINTHSEYVILLSTATVVRTLLSAALYVHCLSYQHLLLINCHALTLSSTNRITSFTNLRVFLCQLFLIHISKSRSFVSAANYDDILLHIIPTRYTIYRVYFYLTLLYVFRALLSPIIRSTKQQ